MMRMLYRSMMLVLERHVLVEILAEVGRCQSSR